MSDQLEGHMREMGGNAVTMTVSSFSDSCGPVGETGLQRWLGGRFCLCQWWAETRRLTERATVRSFVAEVADRSAQVSGPGSGLLSSHLSAA